MRSESAIRLVLPLCAALALAVQPAGAEITGGTARVSICGGGAIDLPLGNGRPDRGRHSAPCSPFCHAGCISRRRSR